MPTYRYECPEGHTLEIVCTIAEMESFEGGRMSCDCGRRLRRDLRMGGRRHITFHEGYYEHISEDGVYISSMSDLKRIAKENGNYSVYAEDLGGAFRAKEGRWI